MADKKGGWCWHLMIIFAVLIAIVVFTEPMLSSFLSSYFDYESYTTSSSIMLIILLKLIVYIIEFSFFFCIFRPIALYHSCRYRKALRGK